MLVLPDVGLHGDSHMMMQDRNSHDVAGWLAGWIDRNVPKNLQHQRSDLWTAGERERASQPVRRGPRSRRRGRVADHELPGCSSEADVRVTGRSGMNRADPARRWRVGFGRTDAGARHRPLIATTAGHAADSRAWGADRVIQRT